MVVNRSLIVLSLLLYYLVPFGSGFSKSTNSNYLKQSTVPTGCSTKSSEKWNIIHRFTPLSLKRAGTTDVDGRKTLSSCEKRGSQLKSHQNSCLHYDELIETVKAITTTGKGILAADESTGTIGQRFSSIAVENNEENRRKYRQLLFKTVGIERYISAMILYEEALSQQTNDGTSFIDLLKSKGIIPGIKVDKGVKPLYGTPGEVVTQGIDDLDIRCSKYYAQGARFAKWRAALHIKDTIGATPSSVAITENAITLARYASICQANGLVPIIEPEVLMDGDFSIEIAAEATERVLTAVYKALLDHKVVLEATLLKPNMVRSGSEARVQSTSQEIAQATVRVLQRAVPAAVPGIAFLSGGMSEEEATSALHAINRIPGPKPWTLTFSYGRALQHSALKAWQGVEAQVPAAQEALLQRARANSIASIGQ